MKSTFLRSTLAALACAGALAFATPSMAAMVNLKADLKASNEVPAERQQGHRLGHRDLRQRQQEADLEGQLSKA